MITSIGKLREAIPTRLVVGLMMFTACWTSYMLRVNMSINILEMVHVQKKASLNTSTSECARQNFYKQNTTVVDNHTHVDVHAIVFEENHPKYDWTAKEQGLVLGAYFWGYIVTSLFGGTLAEMLSPRILIGVSIGLSGVLTLLTPPAASLSYEVVLATRLLIGGLGGVLYPALHCLVANWSPPEEKGKFIGALMGGTFGTVVTWSLCGVIISTMGWEWAFYIPGIITILWTALWFMLVHNSPIDHPRIDEKEKNFILDRIGDRSLKKKPFPPLKDIFLSIPFWAFTILHFGNIWGLYFQLTAGPKFIAQVLDFDISKAGFIASLPYMARVLMAFVFGSIGDLIRKKEIISVTMIRKSFVLFSHIIPGLLLIAITFVGCDQVLSVAIMTASLGINGAATITNLQNHQDLAPNYVGVLYSIANSFGSTTGFITPLITAHYTRERNGIEEWRMIFIIGAVVYITSALIYLIFGSGETQKWNRLPKDDKETVDEKTTTDVPANNSKSNAK